jgi:hypothetical protein
MGKAGHTERVNQPVLAQTSREQFHLAQLLRPQAEAAACLDLLPRSYFAMLLVISNFLIESTEGSN